ncbi:putative acyltransferase [Bernardetia litoralis DSM 6794]|uniref:Putative acyltransferase n=1 Tax=Bernardetia litoralis (strain ATCC 23117 / DSM 6794 / NBRC 15988 / NCIMB 1366 / Fx l1 / Sio-4) TaxID=880071 RepID=I4AIC5_BERLS|nr:GNAT family N-acetyltransferase [Bernardetia litoralis]AFM03710.1 putative acyltransferase [Bernardetia litoralis DSM 6794]
MNIQIFEGIPSENLEHAFLIRRIVFIEGQDVPEEDDFDGLDEASMHILAIDENEKAIGTARFRVTEKHKDNSAKKIKLERFAVLEEDRGKKVGQKMVEFSLEQIQKKEEYKTVEMIYLHAQLAAVSLYERCGFKKEGDIFDESGILHYKMILITT